MGLYVTGKLLLNETTAEKWASVYSEVLRLVDAYDFLDIIFDKERFANYGIVWKYGVKAREREINDETGILIYGALDGCVTAEDQALYKSFDYSSKLVKKTEAETCPDALCEILKNRQGFDELDKYSNSVRTIFGNKTQGFAHHNYLLAICLLLEDRLGKAFVTCGDITRGQIKFAIEWANQHLERPISLPVRMNNEKLLSRLKAFVPQNILLSAFLKLSFNPKDETMGEFLGENFTTEDIFAYWQNKAVNARPGTFGAQDFFMEYFAMSDDLSLLTQVCLPHYTPEEYAKQLATSRIFEEVKETKDPAKHTDVSSERETPESILTVMGKLFGMMGGLKNSAVMRYIPLEKGIIEITPHIPNAEKLITDAMEECKPQNDSYEETIKTFDKANDKIGKDIESADIYDSENLVFYKRGNTFTENIAANLKKIREFVDENKVRMREDFNRLYGEDEKCDKVNIRIMVLVHQGTRLLPKTAWDYFESQITEDEFFNTILGLHGLKSDIVPICYYIKGLLCNRELFEDVLLKC